MHEDNTEGDQSGEETRLPDRIDTLHFTTTHEGATAFQVDDPMLRLVFNYGSFLPGSESHYGAPNEAMMQFIDAVSRAGQAHPELTLQYAAWQRDPRNGKGNRSQSPWVLAVLSSLPACVKHPRFTELVARCIVRPDDALNIIHAATVYLFQYPATDRKNEENLTPPQADTDMRHGNKTLPPLSSGSAPGDNQLPLELKRGVAHGLNAMTDYQLAKYANTRLNLLPERKKKVPKNALPPAKSSMTKELITTESSDEEIPTRTLRMVDVLGICKHDLSPRLFAIYRYLHAPTRTQPSLLPMLESQFPLLANQKFLRANPPQEVAQVEDWLKRALEARMTMEQIFSATGMPSGERQELRSLLPSNQPPEDKPEDKHVPWILSLLHLQQSKELPEFTDPTPPPNPDPDTEKLATLQEHELKQRNIRATLWRTLSVARVAGEGENNAQKQVPFLGDMAFLRNVRDMYRSGIPIADLVAEASRRRFSGLWPFQIMHAASILTSKPLKPRSAKVAMKRMPRECPEVIPVLGAIFERVALETLPRKQDGMLYKILGMADISSSMLAKLGSKNSTATCMDASLSFSVAFSHTTITKDFGGLAGTWGDTFYPVKINPSTSVLNQANKIRGSKGWGGGGTQVFGSMISLISWLLENPTAPRPEVVVILSDMQFHPPTQINPAQLRILPPRYQPLVNQPAFKSMPPLAAAIVLYREILGNDISLVLWNLAAYEGSPVPSGMERVLMLSGFDANTFRIIESWLQAGSPGSAMPLAQAATQEEGSTSNSSFEAVLAALRTY